MKKKDKKLYKLEEIDELIIKYKQGSTEALDELIKAFEGFIGKYANFLKFGVFTFRDKDLMGLMSLISPNTTSIGARAMTIVKVLEKWELVDIEGELRVMFIECARDFVKRKEGPFFAGYLYASYKYRVKEWVSRISSDILNKMNTISMEAVDFSQREQKEDGIQYENFLMSEKTNLSRIERYVLYLYYGKGMSDAAVGKSIGADGTWVCRIRRKARAELLTSGITLEDFRIK